MKSTSHMGFWLIAFLVSLFVAPIATSSEEIHHRLNGEMADVYRIFGDRVGSFIVETSNSGYAYIRRTGVESLLETDARHEENAPRFLQDIASATLGKYLGALLAQFYSFLMRGMIVLVWVAMLLPFLAAAVLDGFCQRKVKLASLGEQIPTAFAIGTHTVIGLSAAPLLYIAIPLPMTPLFMPIWALVIALPMGLAISHMQPVFSRQSEI